MKLFKLNLWLGRTLWGMMLRDEQIALDYLSSRTEVDPQRIGAQGMSMGSTRYDDLIAIRPFLALTGDRDAGSPPEGMKTLEKILSGFYGLNGKTDGACVYGRYEGEDGGVVRSAFEVEPLPHEPVK